MPRWLLWTPIAALTVATAFFGLRAGWYHSNLTETDVIERAAQSYLSGGQGRSPSDCSAVPAPQARVWLTVTCTPSGGAPETYHATRLGTVQRGEPAAAPPET
ncbi:hypothetical protein [Planktotalea arctica]|uniref:hypothetical protein n=1 Tax=Planktotalea arctica TaxID=1481893 RepID=UPI000A175E28|nr:hypothetical protein [Planktotalea arctica]